MDVSGVPDPGLLVVLVGAGSQTMNPTNGLFQASPDPLGLSLVGSLLTVISRLAAVGAGSQTMNPTNGLLHASPGPLGLLSADFICLEHRLVGEGKIDKKKSIFEEEGRALQFRLKDETAALSAKFLSQVNVEETVKARSCSLRTKQGRDCECEREGGSVGDVRGSISWRRGAVWRSAAPVTCTCYRSYHSYHRLPAHYCVCLSYSYNKYVAPYTVDIPPYLTYSCSASVKPRKTEMDFIPLFI
ncbi:hypothetical protein J6590_063620 [Homalodisca vitripennis]|nr:hypothetical protein J6590_063620 [Homalodisca vitripennis]